MKKQPELTTLTRKKLIDTYFEITANGEKATVGAIAEAAGFNRCTFYRYFTDTDQLLYDIETEICDAFQQAISQHFTDSMSFDIIESFATVYQNYGNYISILLGKHGDPRFVSRMKALMQPMASQLLRASSESDIEVELKVEFVLSAVLATITKWYDMGQPISADELGSIIKDILPQDILH